MPVWMKHKLASRLQGEISITSVCRWQHPYGRKQRGTKEPLDEGERGEWKSWLKTQHSKTKIVASGPITSWQVDGETMETETNFIFLDSKITVDGDCSHEIKRSLLLERKAMTNLNRVLPTNLTNRTFADKGPSSQSCDFSTSHVRMWKLYHKEGWVPKNWCFWTMVCFRRFLRLPWTARRSNQSVGKKINSEYSLEGLMLKLKPQYFGHLIRRADSLKKTLMLGTIEDRRWRRWQRTRMLDDITDSTDMSLSKLWEILQCKEGYCAIRGAAKSNIQLSDWTTRTI